MSRTSRGAKKHLEGHSIIQENKERGHKERGVKVIALPWALGLGSVRLCPETLCSQRGSRTSGTVLGHNISFVFIPCPPPFPLLLSAGRCTGVSAMMRKR